MITQKDDPRRTASGVLPGMNRKDKISRNFVKGFLALLLFLPFFLAATAVRVHADIGPHPTMDIEFVWEELDPTEVVEATLYLCEDASCTEERPMEQVALQHITCSPAGCESMAYSYGDFNRLVLIFSDGIQRESNVFEKETFYAKYRCAIRASDLQIEAVAGSEAPTETSIDPSSSPTGSTQETFVQRPRDFIRPMAIGALIVSGLLLLVVIRVGKLLQADVRDQKAKYVGLWIWILALVLLGGLYSLALPLTLLIEGLIVILYASFAKRRRLQWTTAGVIFNLITQPLIWLVFESTGVGPSFALVVVTEIAVWLFEGGLLYWSLRGAASIRETLLLSLLMNSVSYSAGLLIKF
jgi:hypothetical protein